MNVVGIVVEYNPFHLGHEYQLKESRRLAGEDAAVVCVMSGNFVQRGDPAVFSKHARARAAVLGGCDLVFELPLPWSLSSAEGFARGAVGILGALGVVTHLSFGSESGDVEKLWTLAQALMEPDLMADVREALETGLPYAAARQSALEKRLGEGAALLRSPNDILGVEYLKAILDQRLDIEPLTVLRRGASHDGKTREGYPSAMGLRAMLARGEAPWALIPGAAAGVYRQEAAEGRGPVTMEDLDTAVISRLRMLKPEDYEKLPDASEGLGRRLAAASAMEATVDGVLSQAKTKRYAMSRLRRMLLCAALGVTAGMAQSVPPYARILAMNGKGRALLREIGERALLPVITKPATLKQADAWGRSLFELECRASDLYVLGYKSRAQRRGGEDWRKSPFILEN